MRRTGTLGLVVLALFVLGACGGGGDGGGDGALTLTMVDNAFEPVDLTAPAGAEVSLVNDGAAVHNLTVEGSEIDVDVAAGETGTATLDLDPGEYRTFCEYHEAQGMEGTLTVE
jgi:plastocyanin